MLFLYSIKLIYIELSFLIIDRIFLFLLSSFIIIFKIYDKIEVNLIPFFKTCKINFIQSYFIYVVIKYKNN